jgi:hypothetical protein
MARSTCASVVVERRQDARGQRGWTAALDEFDQRVQVDRALARQLLRQAVVEARLAQARAAPRRDLGGPGAWAGVLSGSYVHVCVSADTPGVLTSRSDRIDRAVDASTLGAALPSTQSSNS